LPSRSASCDVAIHESKAARLIVLHSRVAILQVEGLMSTIGDTADWMKVVREPDARRVFEALADDKWDFRTIAGLSASTGIAEDRVRDILRQYESQIRRSLVLDRQGRELYTLASRRPSLREWLSNTRAFIAKSTSSE
jgi:hypothetical protein